MDGKPKMIKNISDHISNEERLAVERVIADCENKTFAEIYAVLAKRSDDYRFIVYGFFGFWIFVTSALLAGFIQWQNGGGWESAGIDASISIVWIFWAQLAAFFTGVTVFRLFPELVKMVVPRRIAFERAHANAVRQFLAHGIHHTKNRTGVLVFVSLEERYGEIIVDRAIQEKIGKDYFLDQVAVLIENCESGNIGKAFELTIAEIGKKLAVDFASKENDTNEIADKMIVM